MTAVQQVQKSSSSKVGQEDTGLWEGGLQGEGKKGRLEKTGTILGKLRERLGQKMQANFTNMHPKTELLDFVLNNIYPSIITNNIYGSQLFESTYGLVTKDLIWVTKQIVTIIVL